MLPEVAEGCDTDEDPGQSQGEEHDRRHPLPGCCREVSRVLLVYLNGDRSGIRSHDCRGVVAVSRVSFLCLNGKVAPILLRF